MTRPAGTERPPGGDGRIGNAELAKRVGLSRAATHARVRKLERLGVITSYTAIVDPETVGFELLCLVGIAMTLPRTRTSHGRGPPSSRCRRCSSATT